MKIEVTQQDIDSGKKSDTSCCPVALAMARAVEPLRVSVITKWASIDGRYHSLPPEVTTFIKRFDIGGAVDPFTFELQL